MKKILKTEIKVWQNKLQIGAVNLLAHEEKEKNNNKKNELIASAESLIPT